MGGIGSRPGKILGPEENFISCRKRGPVTVALALIWLSSPGRGLMRREAGSKGNGPELIQAVGATGRSTSPLSTHIS